MGVDHDRAINHYMTGQNPNYQQQPTPYPQEQNEGIWTEQVPDVVDPETGKLNWRRWGGDMRAGAGETARIGNCPECGSNQYFSRSNGDGGHMMSNGVMAYPKPECFACGYPRQQGAIGTGAKIVGGAIASRQGAAPPPGSLAALQQ